MRLTSQAYRCSCVGPEPTTGVPYALATDVLPLRPGEGFPLEELGRRLAGKDENAAVALAARLPALRRGVVDALVARVARQNAAIAAAVFIPGVDFPVLTLNQLRLVLRIAAAYGEEIDAERLPEILGVVGTALGFRDTRASGGRRHPDRRLGRAGRSRLRRHADARRGGDPLLRGWALRQPGGVGRAGRGSRVGAG